MRLRIPPALRHRRFLLLWLGMMISVSGTQMQIWALRWHISDLSTEPIALTGDGLARILPIILFALIGGSFADVYNRRLIMLVTQSIMAISAFTLAWLTFTGRVQLWQMYALTAVSAAAVAFDTPSRQALIPNLVPARDLANAFSIGSIAFQAGSIVGPALTGFVIAYLGQPYPYLINGFSFLAVIASLILMGPVEQQSAPGKRATVSLGAIKEGIVFIIGKPIILSSMLLDFFATFFASANILLARYTMDVLGLGEVAYGFLGAAQSVGALLAGLVLSQIDQIKRQGTLLLGSVVVFGFSTIAFGLSSTYGVALALQSIIGASDAVSTVIRNTMRQLQTPDYIRGRMTSINQVFFMGGPQLGEAEAGLAAQLLGVPLAIISGGVGCLLSVGWVARRWPQLRTYDGAEAVAAQATAD